MVVLRKLAKSRKAWATISAVLTVLLGHFGLEADPLGIFTLVGIFMTYVAAQGMANSGHAPSMSVVPTDEEKAVLEKAASLAKKGFNVNDVIDLGQRVMQTKGPVQPSEHEAPGAPRATVRFRPITDFPREDEERITREVMRRTPAEVSGLRLTTLLLCLSLASVACAEADGPERHCTGTPLWDGLYADLDGKSGSRRMQSAFNSLLDAGCGVAVIAGGGYGKVVCRNTPCSSVPGPGVYEPPLYEAQPAQPVEQEPAPAEPIRVQLPDWVIVPRTPTIDRGSTAVLENNAGICSCSSSAIQVGQATSCSYRGPVDPLWSIDEGGIQVGASGSTELNIVAELHSAPGVRAATVVGRFAGSATVRHMPDSICDVVTIVNPPPLPEPPPPPPPESFWKSRNAGLLLGAIGTALVTWATTKGNASQAGAVAPLK